MVPQCSGHILTLPLSSSIRAGLSSATDIVGLPLDWIGLKKLTDISADLEMTVNMLIQIDKLVQLIESPVFTCKTNYSSARGSLLTFADLRMQLLEPEKYPYLYKCLYGLLMLLPQSSAFAALKNRLNSVSAIGYLHMVPRGYVASSSYHLRQKSSDIGSPSAPSSSLGNSTSNFDRSNRLKPREEGGVKWTELLDRFKNTQERARRNARLASMGEDMAAGMSPIEKDRPPEVPPKNPRIAGAAAGRTPVSPAGPQAPGHKPKGSLGGLGARFAGGVAGRRKK